MKWVNEQIHQLIQSSKRITQYGLMLQRCLKNTNLKKPEAIIWGRVTLNNQNPILIQDNSRMALWQLRFGPKHSGNHPMTQYKLSYLISLNSKLQENCTNIKVEVKRSSPFTQWFIKNPNSNRAIRAIPHCTNNILNSNTKERYKNLSITKHSPPTDWSIVVFIGYNESSYCSIAAHIDNCFVALRF